MARQHTQPMRDATFCRVLGNRVMANMPNRVKSSIQDMFAELICGGKDENDALTVPEAARYLGRSDALCRTYLQRIHLKVFGKTLGEP